MSRLMLIDAAHPEETRVAIVENGQVDDFDFETTGSEQLRGSIYLAKVTRVEPSLQACFVEYGGNRHGFLAFSEIHPDYYQLPAEDREALLRQAAAEAAAAIEDEDDDEDIGVSDPTESDASDRTAAEDDEEDDEGDEDASGEDEGDSDEQPEIDAETGDDDEDEAEEGGNDEEGAQASAPRRGRQRGKGKRPPQGERSSRPASVRSSITRNYKIQEVIRRRQVMLVQVVKEERGSKGAALTTFLSLAGRYSVLMPNTPRGGGISRKIVNSADRKRLKSIVAGLDVPDGQGLIVRTAGAKRSQLEIKRDYDYLSKLWEQIVEKTLSSDAPALINAEGGLVHRAMRDMFDKDIDEVWVEGDAAFREAKDLAELLMPAQAHKVQAWPEGDPLFVAEDVERQLDSIYSPVVQLKSGGYLVINQTEALVAIDVNSGKSTRERNIENTALRTNLEAAEEACRQMRLRDLAGLIVIDFIDMEENRNNRAVEKRLKECLKADRARVQHGRVSQFGLVEISRQRRRQGVLQATSCPCEACNGTGRRRSIPSAALQVMRALEARVAQGALKGITVRAPTEVALYILNNKRDLLIEIERQAGFAISIRSSEDMLAGDFQMDAERDPAEKPKRKPMPRSLMKFARKPEIAEDDEEQIEDTDVSVDDDDDDDDDADDDADGADDGAPQAASADAGEERGPRRKRKRRRRRKGRGEARETGLEIIATDASDEAAPLVSDAQTDGDEDGDDDGDEESEEGASADGSDANSRKRRRRGRRGGRRRRRDGAPREDAFAIVPTDGGAYLDGLSVSASELLDAQEPAAASEADNEAHEAEAERPAPAPVSDPVVQPAELVSAESSQAEAPVAKPEPAPPAPAPETQEPPGPRRTGWWNRLRGQ